MTGSDLSALRVLLAPVIELVADAVAERVAARAASSAPEFYTASSPPAGMSRGQFLKAARRRDFPNEKVGKCIRARRADVDAWFAAGRRAVAAPANDLTALAAASVQRSLGGRR